MFLIINSLSFPINQKQFGTETVAFSSEIEFILGGVSAVIFGFFADSKGRKRLAVAGFALIRSRICDSRLYRTRFFHRLVVIHMYRRNNLGRICNNFVFSVWGDIGEGKSKRKNLCYRLNALLVLVTYTLLNWYCISMIWNQGFCYDFLFL